MARRKEDIIYPKEELFVRYFTQNDETFGNATQSYAAAYGVNLDVPRDDEKRDENGKVILRSSYDRACQLCAVEGKRLLRKPKIQSLKVKLLNELMTNEVIDAELMKVVKQDEDRASKVAAMREFNKLKNRTTDQPNTIVIPVPIYSGLSSGQKQLPPKKVKANVIQDGNRTISGHNSNA